MSQTENDAPGDIDYARRVGKFRPGQVRPVLVKFTREGLRNEVLFNRNKINKNSNITVWLNDDVSEITRRHRKNARDVATLARQNGINNIKTHSDGLVIDDKKYRFSDFELLPSSLKLGKAKNRDEGEDVFFQGEHSPLTNFFPLKLLIRWVWPMKMRSWPSNIGRPRRMAHMCLQIKLSLPEVHTRQNNWEKKFKWNEPGNNRKTMLCQIFCLPNLLRIKVLGSFWLTQPANSYMRQQPIESGPLVWIFHPRHLCPRIGRAVTFWVNYSKQPVTHWLPLLEVGQLNPPPPPPSVYSGSQDSQCFPMTDDELSDNYEECVQSEDEIMNRVIIPHQDTEASPPSHINSNSGSDTGIVLSKLRNPYHTSSVQLSPGTGETGSLAINQPASEVTHTSNISTRTPRTRRRKKQKSKSQLSQTIPKQAF